MKKTFLGFCALAAIAIAGPANAAVIHNYDLNGSLVDSLGGPDITANGGSIGATGYTFGANQGLTLSGLNLALDGIYKIEVGFSFNTTSGYRKILDFSNLASDSGLYSLGSSLNFYPIVTGAGSVFSPGTLVNLVLSRDATGQVTGSINDIQQISFADTLNRAISNTLHFFIDDFATGQGEASAGFVDYIRISDSSPVSAVPLPAALPLFAAGLAGLGAVARRRRKAKA